MKTFFKGSWLVSLLHLLFTFRQTVMLSYLDTQQVILFFFFFTNIILPSVFLIVLPPKNKNKYDIQNKHSWELKIFYRYYLKYLYICNSYVLK
jgi:hypothetical protein